MNEKFTGKTHAHGPSTYGATDERDIKRLEAMAERIMPLQCFTGEAMTALVATLTVDKKGEAVVSSLTFCRGCLQDAVGGFREIIQTVEDILALEEKKS